MKKGVPIIPLVMGERLKDNEKGKHVNNWKSSVLSTYPYPSRISYRCNAAPTTVVPAFVEFLLHCSCSSPVFYLWRTTENHCC